MYRFLFESCWAFINGIPKKGDYKSEREKLVKGGGVCSVCGSERGETWKAITEPHPLSSILDKV